MAPTVVFLDIAGPDVAALRDFYAEVFGWEFDEVDRFEVQAASRIRGAIREDPAEKRIYLGVPDVTEALAEVEDHGGTVDESRFEVPGVVILGLFRDPAGNPMGLVEMDGDRPRVP